MANAACATPLISDSLSRLARHRPELGQITAEGLQNVPGAAALHEALGLTLVRQDRKQEALAEFAAAAKKAPAEPRYSFVYAVALHDAGRRAEAIRLLEAAAQRTGDRDVLLALASFRQETGDLAGAERYLRALAAINPDDPALPATGTAR
jgi:Flp pilus assembly protein TadD